ncbi:aspartate/glutamate racemase family protein [Rheinheimera tangshanensis]|uniref:Aspartate/glutamate racemase family protein n=1 Tax=Rheinheimera tangshanensis TaxID=400153 RepID=A0A5C8LWX1_9GAMM|nr:aspartate/glutamate racemase family protein [Rheinheimera tangshanensis]TXK80583.1 aspartate/glutamate racemase family protein [Rheinheimera tangshanensis]GGM60132.1 racemase [Rheinheimera tangshanensis]
MKTIGLLGGMSWESTIPYYRQINQHIKQQLGGLHSAKIILYSVDFADIEALQRSGDWDKAAELLAEAAVKLQSAGADCLVLCTNTMHKVAAVIETAVTIPLLHIADATAEAIQLAGLNKVALLGTRFTMEQDFYKKRLTESYGLEVLVPDEESRALVHQVIYQELCLGVVKPDSRLQYQQIMADLVVQGAEAIILGCTEIALLVSAEDCAVPLFDTTFLHAQKAADFALEQEDR